MSSDAPSPETEQDLTVRLKPILGVQPKYYLAAIYGAVVLAILFGLLLWPGLARPGTEVTVTSTPAGAAVIWGGKHYGTTPLTVFLPEGQASLVVSKPGFQADTRAYTSGNSLFASLFFPRRDSLHAVLKPAAGNAVADLARAEVGRWALAVPFTSEYRFPPLFTRLAEDARAAGWNQDDLKAFLLALRPSVADPQMYLDYGRALGLWAADAQAPEGLEAQFKLWEPLVGSGSGRLALWLLANQTKPVRDREVSDAASDWFKARTAEFQASLALPSPAAAAAPGSLRSAAGTFRGVAPARFLFGATGTSFPLPTEPPFALPVPVSSSAFWIADAEVTQADFAAFTAAQPQWAPAGRNALVEAGLADADYLNAWTEGRPSAPAEPVVSVSWYAARAYCDWLNATGRVPAGKKAVLPDEIQWEAAARAPGGASMLNQGVWEWTASAWYPGQSLVWTEAPAPEAQAYARSLKGGLQGAKGSVTAADRAGWPAAGTTTGLGFRVALVGAP